MIEWGNNGETFCQNRPKYTIFDNLCNYHNSAKIPQKPDKYGMYAIFVVIRMGLEIEL